MRKLFLLALLLNGDAVEIEVHPLNAREVAVDCRSGAAPRVKQTNTAGVMLLRCD